MDGDDDSPPQQNLPQIPPELLKEHLVVDAHLQGNCARFANHSCDPNCIVQTVFAGNARWARVALGWSDWGKDTGYGDVDGGKLAGGWGWMLVGGVEVQGWRLGAGACTMGGLGWSDLDSKTGYGDAGVKKLAGGELWQKAGNGAV